MSNKVASVVTLVCLPRCHWPQAKKVFPCSARDAVTVRSVSYEPDSGTFYVASRSVDLPMHPEKSPYVRSTVFCNAWRLQPCTAASSSSGGGDGGGSSSSSSTATTPAAQATLATYTAQFAANGWIPRMLLRVEIPKQAGLVAVVRKAVASFKPPDDSSRPSTKLAAAFKGTAGGDS